MEGGSVIFNPDETLVDEAYPTSDSVDILNTEQVDVHIEQPEESAQAAVENDDPSEDVPPSTCIIHVDENEKSELKRWTNERWALVSKVCEARRSSKNFQTSKHKAIIESLPGKPSKEHGYHTKCYRKFTAVSLKAVPSARPVTPPTERPLRSGSALRSPTSTSGIFPDVCLFCNKQFKTRKNGTKETLGKCETIQAEVKLRETARKLNLTEVLVKISGIDLIAKEAKFHHTCRAEKTAAAERITASQYDEKPDIALDCVCAYVEEAVIQDNRPELLSSIYDRYVDICTDVQSTPYARIQYFGEVLKKKFLSRITLRLPSKGKKCGTIVHNSSLDYESIRAVYDFKSSPEGMVTKAALLLRQCLKGVEKKPLSEPLTINSLLEGEGKAPPLVETFFAVLIGGANTDSYTDTVKRRVDMMSQDALYNVCNGTIRPPKHIRTAMALKSMTGSKKVITLLNRFGHCISYSAAEELETELAYAITERQNSLPEGAVTSKPGGLAFDNYDELCYTLSGSDTLHDTMGIYYQCESTENEIHVPPPNEFGLPSMVDPASGRKKRRRLDVITSPVQPYRKKPRMQNFDYPEADVWSLPDLSASSQRMDLLWKAAHALQSENIPMWIGFNSRFYTDHLPKQIVYYMPNIDRSPTNPDVVAETLRITQKCAAETGQKYGLVTYDLDVARTAIKIQATDQPQYDNVFVLFGGFHIILCLFRAIGKVINESGGPEMLVDSEVLASGSLKGFIECTNYNRCKRLHTMLALAFEILHFRTFLTQYEDIDGILTTISSMRFDETPVDDMVDSPVFEKLFQGYTAYKARTLSGELGKTAQFWMQYVSMVDDYHMLERSIRTNNVDLFITMLTPVTDLFFATNRPNYARWMAKYQLDLMNLDRTHPGLKDMLVSDGLFSVRRTDNQYSRIPVDLTLEQTVNADAASRMTGFTASTNSYSARLRWTVTKGSRAALVAAALEMAGLNRTGDGPAELSKTRIRRDTEDLGKVIRQIESTANPFEIDSVFLVNINTGKGASSDIETSLLTIREEGRTRHRKFNEECGDDPDRFERPIPRNTLKNFTSQGAKNRGSHNPILKELRCTRDLFGRLAIIATKKAVDFQYLMTFPLTPVPLTMCRTDGTLVHTDKSALFKLLESKVVGETEPRQVGAHVIDGNFLLHCLPPLPPTYGKLSRTVLHHILTNQSRRIDIVFDTYEQPWIKDVEHVRRGAEELNYTISGPDQIRPKDFEKALRSSSFKQELPRFFMKDWAQQHHVDVLRDREVFLGVDDICCKFSVVDGRVEREYVRQLHCNHPEADTRVCLHARHIDENIPGDDIIVRAADTDIMVILLHHAHRFSGNVFMDVGTSGRGNRRYVNVTAIALEMGPDQCAAIPGFHAFTGCDYTAAFVRKGKKRPFEILTRNEDFLRAFADLSTGPPDENTLGVIERYTCELYGAKKQIQLNHYRHRVFERSYGPTNEDKPLEKLKGVDASAIPPCELVLKQKISRCSFVARMWNSACMNILPKRPDSGWDIDENGSYRIVWFEGPQMPPDVVPDADEPQDSDSNEFRVEYDFFEPEEDFSED